MRHRFPNFAWFFPHDDVSGVPRFHARFDGTLAAVVALRC